MMLNVKGALRINLSALDKHEYMSDLIYVEGPILSLFRDEKYNWLYLWCDTDGIKTERWMLFPVSRENLLEYLEKSKSLRELVYAAKSRWILDYANNVSSDGEEESVDSDTSKSFSRLLREVKDVENLHAYMPSENSFFSEELAPNISTDVELKPTLYDVPIDGNWFIKDLDNFSNVYSQIYSFFYCTKPQFMTDIGSKVHRFLQSPWKGGFSRVNLFEALQKMVPAIHDLKIHSMAYASPGDITIEAMQSVGDSVKISVLRFRKNEKEILELVRSINIVLNDKALKRADLSKLSDQNLPFPDSDRVYLSDKVDSISSLLGIESELSDLSSRSPNIVVSAKVLLSVVSRIGRLANFEEDGLLDLARNIDVEQI
ncbi:MAG: hypothetical protein WC810_05995 [Janthinobacterium sp.]|jgi:hypothetical protein